MELKVYNLLQYVQFSFMKCDGGIDKVFFWYNDRSLKFPKFDNTDLAKEKLMPPAKFVVDVNIGYINL